MLIPKVHFFHCFILAIEHYENKSLHILKKMLNLERYSPAFKQHASCKNAKELRKNQITLSGLSFVPSAFLQKACFLNVVLEHSRSDLVSQQCRLRNNFMFGMLY